MELGESKQELFVIHFNNKPLHLIKEKYSGWKPSKKVYFTEKAAKIGLHYIPKLIKNNCEIVKYTPENK